MVRIISLGCLRVTNEASTKMTSNEVNTTNVEVPLQVMTKDPKKVEAGKRLTEFNCKTRSTRRAAHSPKT